MSSKAKTTVMKNDDKPALMPKLRFPEFRDAEGWTQHRLGEICKLYQAETISSSDFIPDGQHLVYGANGVVGRLNRYNHESEEVAVSCRGNCGEVHFTQPRSWITGNAMIVSPAIGNLSKAFLYRLLIASDLKPVISGSAQPQITRQGFSPFVVALPLPLEQQKIADCLTSVDELIAALARKVDALKTHKKGLMRQLFPREGETQPRLRFPEFREQWGDTQLENICSSISSGRDQMEPEGEFDLYGSTSVIGKTRNPSFSGARILVARVGANAGLITKASGQFGVTDNTLVVSLNPSTNIDYIVHYLGNLNLNRLVFGSGQPLITGSILKTLRIPVPTAAEQQKISVCLTSLDELIRSQSHKLEDLKTHKKGLLQQLFPSMEEL